MIGLTLSTFIFNTSEFIPIGLLSGIASDFAISESQAGLLITVYAWVVAIASLPLMLVFAKTENRRLMLSIVALFVFSHILSGVAANYNMLMISRMGVACSHAIFWSIVTPLAVRVAPEGKGPSAYSQVTAVLLCVLWGFAINSFNLTFQTEIIRNAPQGTSVAMSIYSGIYNVGIGTGALVGGSVCSDLGIPYIGYVGGAIALVAAVYFVRSLLPLLLRR